MKRALTGLAFALLVVSGVAAQTTTYTWSGSDVNSAALTSINGQPVDPAEGYSGLIYVVNHSTLANLELPDIDNLPNNGFMDCWAAVSWQTPVPVIQHTPTQVGDTYNWTGTASCFGAQVTFTENHQYTQSCYVYHGVKHCNLMDTIMGGNGSVVVQ